MRKRNLQKKKQGVQEMQSRHLREPAKEDRIG